MLLPGAQGPRRIVTIIAAYPTADTLIASDALLATLPTTTSAKVLRELDAGARIGRYFVIERLGAGAMGVVYAAYDPKLRAWESTRERAPGR